MHLIEGKRLLEKYGIPFVKGEIVRNENELNAALKKVGFPVAMKVISEQVLHKTDVGGVELNIETQKEALLAYNKILRTVKFHVPNAVIDGIFVQKFLQGKQLIIGGKMDEQFGPTILFGLGGIFVEVMKDVSLRICPITRKDAKEMIKEIKGYKLLKGVRGEKAINFQKLENILMKTNTLLLKEKIKELDINPLIANEKEVIAVDARVIK